MSINILVIKKPPDCFRGNTMKKVLTLTLFLVALAGATEIPYKIVNGEIVWKPIANDIQKVVIK